MNKLAFKLHFFACLVFLQFHSFAQFPFEKFQKVKAGTFNTWEFLGAEENGYKLSFRLKIPTFFKDNSSLEIRLKKIKGLMPDTCIYNFYHNSQLVQSLEENQLGPVDDMVMVLEDSIRMADFNGDGLNDLKFVFRGWGNGAFNIYCRVYYLLQNPEGALHLIGFTDMMERDVNNWERDLDGDGNYELIVQNFLSYQGHSYWNFNLYHFENYQLVNWNHTVGYPLLVQIKIKPNFKETDLISIDEKKKFALQLPNNYFWKN